MPDEGSNYMSKIVRKQKRIDGIKMLGAIFLLLAIIGGLRSLFLVIFFFRESCAPPPPKHGELA